MNEQKISVGCVCLSAKGHDKGKAFLVFTVDGDYAYIVNGKDRKKQKPKKKKIKHLKFISAGDITLTEKLQKGEEVANEKIRKLLTSHN
jgi:ribosomal protein L14E/L6E/L27E